MLFRSVLRTLFQRRFQLLLLGVMMLLSSFIYTMMDYSIEGLLTPTEEYFETYKQEDFAMNMVQFLMEDDYTYLALSCPLFIELPMDQWPVDLNSLSQLDEGCYQDIVARRMNQIKDVYPGLTLEARESKDIVFDWNEKSYKFRVLKDMEQINLSYILEGTKPDQLGEIAVSEIFANKNNLQIGDELNIGENQYIITGFVLFPDYTLSIFGNSLIIDNLTQSVVLMSNEAFEALPDRLDVTIAGLLNAWTKDDFESDVIQNLSDHAELSFLTSAVLTENNLRSGGVYADIQGGQGMGIVMSLLIASIALLIVSVMISRILTSQRGAIGILQSLGYTNREIGWPYVFFIGILSLPMIVIGYLIGLKGATPMMNMYLEFYVLPHEAITQSTGTILIAIIMPLLFLLFIGTFIIMRMLRVKPVELLQPDLTPRVSKLSLLFGKRIHKQIVQRKLRMLLLTRNMTKFVVYLVGMFYAAFLILLTFGMNDLYDRMMYDYYDNTNHNYIGYCDYSAPCQLPSESEGTYEPVIEIPSALANGKEVMLVGLSPTTTLHPLLDRSDKNITNELYQGFIATKSLSLLRGYKVGDEIEIKVGSKSMSGIITAITEEYTGNKLYVNKADLGYALTGDRTYFNAVYSDVSLSADDYLIVVDIDNIIHQADSMNRFMNISILLLASTSIIIGAIIIYILTALTVEDNFYNISLFKVIGYDDKEINSMVIGGYFRFGMYLFIAAIPVGILTFQLMEWYFAQYYELVFPMRFYWWHSVIAIVIYVILFELGALAAKYKLSRISLQEAMKQYQI
jgi:putative ABC transport system permease protein